METVKLAGAVPVVGVTTSHPEGVLVAVAVKLPLVALVTVTATVWVAGVAPPTAYEKVRGVVDAPIVVDAPTIRVTGTVTDVPPTGETVTWPV